MNYLTISDFENCNDYNVFLKIILQDKSDESFEGLQDIRFIHIDNDNNGYCAYRYW
jgi:hypothetical protein